MTTKIIKKSLRVLIVEDSESDTEIVLRNIRSSGYDVTFERVENKQDMQAALSAQGWDVIISDHSLPQFSAPAALDTLKESGLDLPFIIVSGAMGEELAVEMMRAGAHDFLIKSNISRLGPIIEREMREAANRQARREADKELRRHQELLAFLAEVGGILGSSLDHERTVKNAIMLVVPLSGRFRYC